MFRLSPSASFSGNSAGLFRMTYSNFAFSFITYVTRKIEKLQKIDISMQSFR